MHLEEITDKILKVSGEEAPASTKPQNTTTTTTTSQPGNGPSPTTPTTAPPPAVQHGPAPPPVPTPALPPQLAHNAGKSVDEILADLNKSPLFMTELEDNNEHLEALQALSYEGTPLENASDFKGSGNEAFREKRWGDAAELYGRGIAVLTPEERRRAAAGDSKPDDEDDAAGQRAVLEALLVNRAACHLELRNFRACYLDCHAALRLNPRSLKAWYRSARALLAVGRTAEAQDACSGGLAVDPDNGALRTLARDVAARAAADAEKSAAEEQRNREAGAREAALRAALADRGVRVRRSARPPDVGDAAVELDGAGALTFPTVLLYPAHYESDFIKAFSEKESLMQHFGYVFPLPWDREGEYSASGVECFMETVGGGLVRVGKKVALLKVLGMDNVEVVDGVVRIYVVPKAKAEGWVKEFKAAKAKEKEREGK